MAGQNAQIKFNCTTEEWNKIKMNAEKIGLTIKQYILYTSLNTEVKIEVKVFDMTSVKDSRNKFRSSL